MVFVNMIGKSFLVGLKFGLNKIGISGLVNSLIGVSVSVNVVEMKFVCL